MPLFTIIVPTYNRPGMLAEALDSVQRQTFEDFECVVVEDGPPAPVGKVPDDSRFRLIRHDRNRGLSAARNTGLESSRGDYVTFLDDDDRLSEDRLEVAQPLLSQDHVVVCGRAGMRKGVPVKHRNLQGYVYDSIIDGYPPHTGQTVVPLKNAPRFDERYAAMEDVEWWLRLSRDLPVVSTRQIGYQTRSHDGARHGNGREARARCSRMFLQEYGEYFRQHRRAHAFRLDRLARLEAQLGLHQSARAAAWQSVRIRPRPRSIYLAVSLSQSTWSSSRRTRDGQAA